MTTLISQYNAGIRKVLWSGHLTAPQFWEGPLISGKVSVPLKNDPFEEVKIIIGPPKKISTQAMDVPCAFCKKN